MSDELKEMYSSGEGKYHKALNCILDTVECKKEKLPLEVCSICRKYSLDKDTHTFTMTAKERAETQQLLEWDKDFAKMAAPTNPPTSHAGRENEEFSPIMKVPSERFLTT